LIGICHPNFIPASCVFKATLMSPQRQASARAYIQNLDIGAMTFDSSSSEEDERTTYV